MPINIFCLSSLIRYLLLQLWPWPTTTNITFWVYLSAGWGQVSFPSSRRLSRPARCAAADWNCEVWRCCFSSRLLTTLKWSTSRNLSDNRTMYPYSNHPSPPKKHRMLWFILPSYSSNTTIRGWIKVHCPHNHPSLQEAKRNSLPRPSFPHFGGWKIRENDHGTVEFHRKSGHICSNVI